MIKFLASWFKAFVHYPDDRSKPLWKRRLVAGTIVGVAISLFVFTIAGTLIMVEHFFGKIAAICIAFVLSIAGVSVAIANEVK